MVRATSLASFLSRSVEIGSDATSNSRAPATFVPRWGATVACARVLGRVQRQSQHSRQETGQRSRPHHSRSGPARQGLRRRRHKGRARSDRQAARSSQGRSRNRMVHRRLQVRADIRQSRELQDHAPLYGVRDRQGRGRKARASRNGQRGGRASSARTAPCGGAPLFAKNGQERGRERIGTDRYGGSLHGPRSRLAFRPGQEDRGIRGSWRRDRWSP